MAGATDTATDLRTPLAAIVGDEHVRDDAGALLTFSTDATPLERGRPDVVVFPATTEEVAAVIRFANERRVPVIPRGSGTNLSAGTVPHRGGIVLVLTRMDRLIQVDPATSSRCASPACGRSSSRRRRRPRACSSRPTRAATRPRPSAATSPSAAAGSAR
jgi:hypothetical protein